MDSALVLIFGILLFALSHESESGFLDLYPKLKEFFHHRVDVGAPLFLTPLIESGKIEEARLKATVQHKEMNNIKSYSGYFTVNKEYNSNLFFWFFPAVVSNDFNLASILACKQICCHQNLLVKLIAHKICSNVPVFFQFYICNT